MLGSGGYQAKPVSEGQPAMANNNIRTPLWRRWWMILFYGFSGFVLLIGIIAALSDGGDQASAPVTAAAPTAKTEESGPCASPEAQDYLLSLSMTHVSIEARRQDVKDLGDQLVADATLYFDPDWIAQMGGNLGAIQHLAETIKEIDPPSIFKAGHRDQEKAADKFQDYATQYIKGIDDLDGEALEYADELAGEAWDLVGSGNAKISEACG